MKKTRILGLVGVLALSLGATPRLSAKEAATPVGKLPLLDGGAEPGARPKYVPDQILVRFKPGVSRPFEAYAHTAVGAKVLRRFRLVDGLQLVRIPAGMNFKEALETYRRNPDVLYAEPNYLLYADVNPNDTNFPDLWGLHNTGQAGGTPDADIDAPQAWDLTTGSSTVVVAVIDTGIDYTHPDLAANMLQLETNCSDGVDNDGNGFVDDCFGIDTLNGDSDPMDDNEHGTHVAGTIGAVGNNNQGVVGVNWTVRLLACKFLGADGSGSTSGAIDCLDYLEMMKDRGVNLVATNNSWGGGGSSLALRDAIDSHRLDEILFIAAAGNESTDNDLAPHFPSNYYLPNIISVAATTRQDARASFSNFGRQTVHLGAPGQDIKSTTPGNTYSIFSGTSMATPHVTGVAALLKAQDATRDWKEIRNLILAGGDARSDLNSTVTRRRLNALGSLTCSNSVVLSRLRPVGLSITATVGNPLTLAVLHINCELPNGSVDVSVPGGTVTLADTGTGADQEAGDGIYSGEWVPSALGTYTLTFPGGDAVSVRVLSAYASSSTAFSYRTLKNPNSLALSDDSVATVIPPFPILFGGVSFTQFFVSSNGLISFDSAFASPENEPLPVTQPATVVAAFWDDLFPLSGTGKNVFTKRRGTTPNREFIVEWKKIRHFDCNGDSTAWIRFQVVFFEGKSDILFNFLDTTFGGACTFADGGGAATVGLQVAPGTGTQFSFDTPSLSASTAILWQVIPPPPAPPAGAAGAGSSSPPGQGRRGE